MPSAEAPVPFGGKPDGRCCNSGLYTGGEVHSPHCGKEEAFRAFVANPLWPRWAWGVTIGQVVIEAAGDTGWHKVTAYVRSDHPDAKPGRVDMPPVTVEVRDDA
jgi:hypothetical protein